VADAPAMRSMEAAASTLEVGGKTKSWKTLKDLREFCLEHDSNVHMVNQPLGSGLLKNIENSSQNEYSNPLCLHTVKMLIPNQLLGKHPAKSTSMNLTPELSNCDSITNGS